MGVSAVDAPAIEWRLGGFDLDGTLIHGTSTLLHLGHQLGCYREFSGLVRSYESFAMSNREVTERAALHFRGFSRPELKALMDGVPVLENLAIGVDALHQMAIDVVISTVTFDFAAEWCAEEFNFDDFTGVRLEFDSSNRATGRVLRHCDEMTKALDIRRAAHSRGVTLGDVFFCGDSRSDLETFKEVGLSIALNGSANAVSTADVAIETSDFLDLVGLVFGTSSVAE